MHKINWGEYMKNALSYYYNIISNDIHQIENVYRFKLNEEYYSFTEIEYSLKEIETLYKVSIDMNNKGIYTHQFVINNQNSLITQVNGKNYVLIKAYSKFDEKINIQQIIYFSNQTKNISNNAQFRRDNWLELWTTKLDYFEYQISQLGKKYPLIRESFSYFEGLAETGVTMLVNQKQVYNELVIAHKRITKDNTLYDLYNPLNFIIDYKVRDASEYFKDLFKNNINPLDNIKTYIETSNLNTQDYINFYIRMFYPSFYFDLYETIIEKNQNDEELKIIISKITQYEVLLKELTLYLKKYINIPEIEWIKKT